MPQVLLPKRFSQLEQLKFAGDPFKGLFVDTKVEEALSHTYDASKKRWIKRTVQVKVQTNSFGSGDTRQAYKAKVMDKASDWQGANNMVLKEFLDPTDNSKYFESVQLQTEAQILSQAFSNSVSATGKTINFAQISVLEFIQRDFAPVFSMENYVTVGFKKNSSGLDYSSDEAEFPDVHKIPQAFSHYSFVKTDFKKIIVEISEVNGIFTDPKVHTIDGEGYGLENLGLRGIALFFLSHRCNEYCEHLQLPKVELHSLEMTEEVESAIRQSVTDMSLRMSMTRRTTGTLPPIQKSSWSDVDSSRKSKLDIKKEHSSHPIASVHYGIADLYCAGWYMSMETEAALFHLDKAAREFKNLKAMAIFGSKLLGQETDELEDLNVKKDVDAGWAMIEDAARLGEKNCIWKMAQRNHLQLKDYPMALKWYNYLYDQGVNTPFIRFHMIIAQIADIHFKGGNGLEIGDVERLEIAADKFHQAAKDAKRDGRVRQAQKYEKLAEEVYDQMDQ